MPVLSLELANHDTHYLGYDIPGACEKRTHVVPKRAPSEMQGTPPSCPIRLSLISFKEILSMAHFAIPIQTLWTTFWLVMFSHNPISLWRPSHCELR